MKIKKTMTIVIFSAFVGISCVLYFITRNKLSFNNEKLNINGTELVMQLDKGNAYNSDWLTTKEIKTLCGVNCLFLVSEYYDLKIPYADLRFLLEPSSRGTSMKRLKDVAENLGFTVNAQKIDSRNFHKLDCPFIIFAPKGKKESLDGHYVVGLPLPSSGGVAFYDPPRKTRVVARSELERNSNRTYFILSLYHD